MVEVLLLRGLLPHPLHRGLAAALHPGRRTRLTSLVDLTRTVLDLAGCRPHAADLDGAVLTDVLDGSAPDGGGIAISEYYAHGTDRPARMLRQATSS